MASVLAWAQQPAVDEPAMDEPAPIADSALPGPSAAVEPSPAEAEPEQALAVADGPTEAPSSGKHAIAAMPEAQKDALVAKRLRETKPELYQKLLADEVKWPQWRKKSCA